MNPDELRTQHKAEADALRARQAAERKILTLLAGLTEPQAATVAQRAFQAALDRMPTEQARMLALEVVEAFR